jgi:hypothetical protein
MQVDHLVFTICKSDRSDQNGLKVLGKTIKMEFRNKIEGIEFYSRKMCIHGYSVGTRENFEINSEQYRFQREKLLVKEEID